MISLHISGLLADSASLARSGARAGLRRAAGDSEHWQSTEKSCRIKSATRSE
jgi:hypothetical protein